MQLVTFGIDKDMNLIIQFPAFIQPYTQKPLILYQLETVPVPILDRNTKAQSYMHLQVRKPHIALNSETYISLRQQELRSCKRIDYEFYCEELSIVKHKSSYSCESAIYFNLTTDIIKSNCNFNFYFNKTDTTPTVLDAGDEIVLDYVLVNRSIWCNWGIEADNHFLLESIAACDIEGSNLVMYFTINMASANYIDILPNLTNPFQLIKDRTTYEPTLPYKLKYSRF